MKAASINFLRQQFSQYKESIKLQNRQKNQDHYSEDLNLSPRHKLWTNFLQSKFELSFYPKLSVKTLA